MSPSIPGVDRDGLAAAIHYNTRPIALLSANRAADVAIAYIDDHQESRACTCGAKYDRCPDCAADDGYAAGRKDAARDHADEWVEVDEGTWITQPDGTRMLQEWVNGAPDNRFFVHRDDLPDPEADLVERMAKAIWSAGEFDGEWSDRSSAVQERYRKAARAALAVQHREEDGQV